MLVLDMGTRHSDELIQAGIIQWSLPSQIHIISKAIELCSISRPGYGSFLPRRLCDISKVFSEYPVNTLAKGPVGVHINSKELSPLETSYDLGP